MNEFYETKKNSYESYYLQLLSSLSFRMVVQYESDRSWYKNKEGEICVLLENAAKKCYTYDEMKDAYSERGIEDLKLCVYKFCSYCRKSANSD